MKRQERSIVAGVAVCVALALASGATHAAWDVTYRIVYEGGRTELRRVAADQQPDGAYRARFKTTDMTDDMASIDVVAAAASVPKGEGYWVLGDGHYGRFTRDNGEYVWRKSRLSLYGVCRPASCFVGVIKGLRTEYTSHALAKNGRYEIFPRFELKKIEFRPYEDIVIDYYPLTGADANYSGMARRYRQWQLDRGEVKPLREKVKNSPALEWSAKSIFLRCKFGRTFRRDIDHKSFATNTPPMTVDKTFDDFMDIMRRAKALKMDYVDMCMVGWQREGHDGPFPDHFPVDPRFGGEAKMREAVALGHALGYRMSVHLNYHNYYPAAKRWRDADVCKGVDGKPRPYWLLPAGLSHYSCFEVMVNRYVDDDFAHLRDIGVDGILHHDVTSAEYPTPCHDPQHPNSRLTQTLWQLRLCDKCRETFGGSSSESGLDHIAKGLDNILYVAWDVSSNKMVDGMLPLWPIVYNGICMSQPFYGTMDAPYVRDAKEKFSEGKKAFHWIPTPEERMLKVFEWGGRPAFYYNTYADLKPMKRMYDLWQPIKHLQYEFIHEHVELAPKVTATRYENGEEVVCNHSQAPYAYRGRIIAPRTYAHFGVASVALVPQPQKVTFGGDVTANTTVREVVDASIPAEGYRLSVGKAGVTIAHSDPAGAFYARQTLKQLEVRAPKGAPTLACAEIEDAPQLAWRGVLLDECRHFFGKETVKSLLDLMAQHKLNVLHWHLTDDQGWRIEVPNHPELVQYGAKRKASPKYGARATSYKDGAYVIEMNDEPYGPHYYTEADIREIIAYAAARQIRIVPEVELPGHVMTVLAAHPEFACKPENLADRSPRLTWGVPNDVLCVGNDDAIRFMEEIVDYVCRLFPSDVVHIGGDECPRVRWKDCPKCQERIRREGLKDVSGLQPWATRHFLKFLADRGKRTIGWDVYLLGGDVPKSAIGMSWRMKPHPVDPWASSGELASRGYDLVIAHSMFCYLDYDQRVTGDPFPYIGGNLPLAKCYAFDAYNGIAANDRAHILGAQACCWSEFTWNRFDLEWKTWPRLCALAEAFWTGTKKPGYEDFRKRLKVHHRRLRDQHVNCAPLEDE